MKKRKIPLRLCLGCGEKRDKRKMIRIVKTPDDEILLDDTGKKPGRGAYICGQPNCFEAALKTKKLERSLKTSISQEAVNNIRNTLYEQHQR